jgi:hypothetical protein
MFGWKAKATVEEEPMEPEPLLEEDLPTWADGSIGPNNPASRVYGRQRNEADYESRLASAE